MMAFATPTMRQLTVTSLRSLASSSRYTLLHPLPNPLFCRSTVSHLQPTGNGIAQGRRRMYSVAQQHPVETAAFENTPAPPYLSPVGETDKGKGGGASAQASGSASTTAAPVARRRAPRAQKAAIKMTPAAIDHLRALVSSPTEPKLLRIGVKTRGCAGMAYHLEYVPPPGGRFDEVVEQDGVRVLIDSKALFSIIGSTMDWRDNRLSAGFVFENPNVVDTCGCGESFNTAT